MLSLFEVLRDRKLLARYAITGILVASLYVALHLLLTRAFGVTTGIASAGSLFVALVFQYFMHSQFTFKVPASDGAQLSKFVITVFSGYIVSHSVMEIFIKMADISDIYGLLFVVLLLPIVNFFVFSIWVFARSKTGVGGDKP